MFQDLSLQKVYSRSRQKPERCDIWRLQLRLGNTCYDIVYDYCWIKCAEGNGDMLALFRMLNSLTVFLSRSPVPTYEYTVEKIKEPLQWMKYVLLQKHRPPGLRARAAAAPYFRELILVLAFKSPFSFAEEEEK